MVLRQETTRRPTVRRVVAGAATVAAAVALGAAVVPLATAAPAAPAAAHAAASNSGSAKYLASLRWYQKLVDSVTAQVVALYPNAYLLEIDGVSPTGPVSSVFGVTSWRFDFNAVIGDDHRIVVQATVDLPNTTPSIHVEDGVWSGSAVITEPVAMSAVHAGVLLRQAGYTKPFRFITYRQPIESGFDPHPLYIFDQGEHDFVGVDTITGEVAPL